MSKFMTAAVLALYSAASQSAPVEAAYKDWFIGCDNTRRCEAVGYHVETEHAAPVALALRRDAGPGTPVVATLAVSGEEPSAIPHVSIAVKGWRLDGLAVDTPWTSTQAKAIIPKLLDADVAVFRSGKRSWRLSLAGAKAALLKMDEVQGRLGTPGALVRTGTRPEAAVPPAPPAPVLRRAARVGAYQDVPPAMLKALPKTDCVTDGALRSHRLGSAQLLIFQECHRGAYQSTYRVWTSGIKPPYRIAPVALPQLDGSMEEEVFEPDVDDGLLTSAAKGRGLYDCGIWSQWVWTAEGFKLLAYDSAPQCRGIPGGVPVRLWAATLR